MSLEEVATWCNAHGVAPHDRWAVYSVKYYAEHKVFPEDRPPLLDLLYTDPRSRHGLREQEQTNPPGPVDNSDCELPSPLKTGPDGRLEPLKFLLFGHEFRSLDRVAAPG